MIVFYDELVYWCNQNGVSPTRAAVDCGLAESAPSHWKRKGFTPRREALEKLADYFGITIDELLDHTKSFPSDMVEQMQDELFDKRKILFDLSGKATEQDLDKFIKMMKVMLGDDE